MTKFAMMALALVGLMVLGGCCNKCKVAEPDCGCGAPTPCTTCDK